MLDLLLGLLILVTAGLCLLGASSMTHWLARVSSGPAGRRWWFWPLGFLTLATVWGTFAYQLIYGLVSLACTLLIWCTT